VIAAGGGGSGGAGARRHRSFPPHGAARFPLAAALRRTARPFVTPGPPRDDLRVGVLGFGNQGRAQALALRGAGVEVVVGARPGGPSADRAREQGFEVRDLGGAAAWADVVVLLLPDEAIPEAWRAIGRDVRPGAAVLFAHGFALRFGALDFSATLDVVLVSPTGPGRLLGPAPGRAPLAGYLAVHQDATGAAWARAERYARRLGLAPLRRTTVAEETEIDLFGEQTVLCGGMNALVRTAFEVLVERGYTPEIAYLECVHQLKHLADLLHERGVAGLREAISGTALYGDLTRGPRVIGPESRAAMVAILEEIRSGSFAREWRDEVERGRPTLLRGLAEGAAHPIEAARKRALEP
jgi:ketol-acid reductoisomerase